MIHADTFSISGYNHEYKRHATTSLFAAFEVANGQVKIGHFNHRQLQDLLRFMNRVIAEYGSREIHVIPDNFCITNPKTISGWPDIKTSIFITPPPMPRG